MANYGAPTKTVSNDEGTFKVREGSRLDLASTATAPSSTTPPAPNTALTSQSLTPQASFNITPPKQSTAMVGWQGYMDAQNTLVSQQRQQLQSEEQDLTKWLMKQGTETGIQDSLYKDTGVDTAKALKQEKDNKMIKSRHAQQRELEALGKNGALTPAQMNAQSNAINRRYTFEQADIAIEQLAADGDYYGAKEVADRAVTAMLEQQRLDREARIFNYQEHKELFNKNEQRLYESMESERGRLLDNEEYRLRAQFQQKIEQQNAAYTHSLANQPMPGENPQLYSGLNSATATAVRAKVNDYASDAVVKNFAVIKEGRNFAGSLDDQTKNSSDDQGLIYALAKALDPASVVREGEYATAQKYSQSLIDAYGTGVTQAINGTGFLTPEARRKIKDTIEARYQASLGSYQGIKAQYETNINSLTGRSDGAKFLPDYNTSIQSVASQADLPTLAKQKGFPPNELQEAIQQYGEEAVRKFLNQ